jgi:O-antigen ligase
MFFAVFLAALFFAPLAFGTTETWSTATLELLVALAGVGCFFPFFFGKNTVSKVPGLVPLLLFIGWMWLQCVLFPAPLVGLLSPNTLAAYQPLLDILPPDTWIPLTLSQHATLLECLRLSTYALLYVLTVQLLSRSSRRVSQTVIAVAVLSAVLAFASIIQRAVAPDTLFWFRELKSRHLTFGPWVNRNQYAGFMVMTSPLLLALFLLHRSAGWQGESFREKFIALFSGPEATHHLFYGFGTLVALSSIFLSQSRGGVISIIFALLLFFLLLARSQGKLQTLTLLLLIICLSILIPAAGWFSWDTLFDRFSATLDAESGRLMDARLPLWQDTLKIILDFPVTGAGFGSFQELFPSYKSFADRLVYDHAHNDYLELLTDGGVIGFLLATWFVGAVLKKGLRQIVLRQDRAAVLFSIAAFSGISGALVYSLTDFNMHNGADGLYFFFLCGLLISASHTRQHYHQRPTLLNPAAKPFRAKLAGFAAAAALLITVLRIQGGDFLAEEHYQQAHNVSASMRRPEKKLIRMTALLEQARKSNPFNSLYPFALGNLKLYQQDSRQALELYKEAALLQPLEGSYPQDIGLLLADADLKTAKALIEQGYRRDLQKDETLRTWAEFAITHSGRAEAVRILRTELDKDHGLLAAVYPLMREHEFTQEETVAALPESASAWLHYWELARADGQEEKGRFFIEHALEHLDREPKLKPQLFMQMHSYWRQRKQEEQAVEVLREGIRRLPDYAPFHIHLGDYYWAKGISYRALEEYEQARLLQPGNAALQDKIKKLKKEQQRSY